MMLTRCPECSTLFRVTSEQLKARQARVRCGACEATFNALDALEDVQLESEIEQPAPEQEEVAPPQSEPISETVSEPVPKNPEGSGTLTEDAAVADGSEKPGKRKSGRSKPSSDRVTDRRRQVELPPFLASLPEEPPEENRHRAIWATLAVLALTVSILQGLYLFRAEVAVRVPELRPVLDEMCVHLKCDIPLPRLAELVSIENSELHPDPQRNNLLVLYATLRNRAEFEQAYPHLELALTDASDQTLSQRVFKPEEYLPKTAPASFGPNAELALSLWLSPEEMAATGYRLYLFYP